MYNNIVKLDNILDFKASEIDPDDLERLTPDDFTND